MAEFIWDDSVGGCVCVNCTAARARTEERERALELENGECQCEWCREGREKVAQEEARLKEKSALRRELDTALNVAKVQRENALIYGDEPCDACVEGAEEVCGCEDVDVSVITDRVEFSLSGVTFSVNDQHVITVQPWDGESAREFMRRLDAIAGTVNGVLDAIFTDEEEAA